MFDINSKADWVEIQTFKWRKKVMVWYCDLTIIINKAANLQHNRQEKAPFKSKATRLKCGRNFRHVWWTQTSMIHCKECNNASAAMWKSIQMITSSFYKLLNYRRFHSFQAFLTGFFPTLCKAHSVDDAVVLPRTMLFRFLPGQSMKLCKCSALRTCVGNCVLWRHRAGRSDRS